MDNIFVIEEKCNGCAKCRKVCGYGAITITNRKAKIDLDKCTLCRACENVCETGAISILEIERSTDLNDYKGIWVFIEYISGELNPLCLQILSKGYELSRKTRERLTAVVVGQKFKDVGKIKVVLAECGASEVKLLQSSKIANYQPEDVTSILADEILTEKPSVVLFLGTHIGRSLAPRVASKVKAGITADCTELYIDEEKNLVQVRPTYGGRILASIICPNSRPQMASVRPNVFDVGKKKGVNPDKVILELKDVDIDSVEKIKKVMETVQSVNRSSLIDEAEVIVCGGYGVGSKEGFDLLERLANKLGGAVAGTRAAVDEGWIEFSRQIGQTGKTIRPRVYIGCGVSGAIHHIIGIKNSRKIIAVNKDPRAPIFKIADIGIIGDLNEIIPKLISSL
jgi:electron transfer flavoprotein alpha subunit